MGLNSSRLISSHASRTDRQTNPSPNACPRSSSVSFASSIQILRDVIKMLPQEVQWMPQVVQCRPQVIQKTPQVVQEMSQVVQVLPHVVQERPQVLQVRPLLNCPAAVDVSLWLNFQPASASTVVGSLRPRNGPLSLGVTQQVQLQQQPPQPQTLQLQQQQHHHHQPWSQGEKVPPQPQRPQQPEPTS